MQANNRADLLAQEVDENHAKLEQSTQNKLLYVYRKLKLNLIRRERSSVRHESSCLQYGIIDCLHNSLFICFFSNRTVY